MSYIGTCPECGARVTLHIATPWRIYRHGEGYQCKGTDGEPVKGTVVFVQSGRRESK